MSRSRRHTPIVGMTTAVSEKREKVRAHRRARHIIKVRLRQQQDDAGLPLSRALHDPWTFAKDGKERIDPQQFPRLMRK
jgi:hypothetical protein